MMRRNPQRLAWTVLLASLFVCIGLAVSVPLALGSYINDTEEPGSITLEVQQGTALVRRADNTDPIGVTTSINNLQEGTSIQADENVQALLIIRSPRDNTPLQQVQIYGNTNLSIMQAHSPRFQQSTMPHQINLNVEHGRVRANVVSRDDRPLVASVTTPQATTQLQEGSYAFLVTNDETEVTVREGQADVTAQGTQLALGSQQRTVVKLGSRPSGILSPERNMVANGNFRLPLDGTWEVYNDLQNPDESPGTITIANIGGQRSAVFDRVGKYHAETGMRQAINTDVRDFRLLELHFVVTIYDHDVPVCGQAGSECPMMMRLDYKDNNGTDRSFWQGFYSQLDDRGVNPTYNTTSGSRNEHIRVSLGVPSPYESGDLMAKLSPTEIKAITFYASGHTYRSSVAEIELLGEQ